ncbi:MAG: CvpA family protein [Tepidisphaerales bacterium]
MISVFIIIIIGVVGYWHYTQGFFSSTLSAFLATVAAVFAVGWHEKLTDMLLKGRFADEAYAITLVAIFVLVYSLGRLTFDKLVPGNLRFPAIVDKIGAGVMGVIAGLACAAIVMLAAQTLPFSESILWWERYEVAYDKQTTVQRERDWQQIDARYDELSPEKFLNNQPNSPVVAPDEMLLGLVGLLSSENGSLSTGRPWGAVHPDYLQELFGQRLAQMPNARHCALAEKIAIADVCSETTFEQFDQERFVTQQGVAVGTRGPRSKVSPMAPVRKATANTVFIIVRATLDADNRDLKTNVISFPAAAARVCLPVTGDPAGRLAANYFPIGTLEPDHRLFANQPDDMLFAQPNKVVEFVFEIPRKELKGDAREMRLPDGSFFEFKRLAREDLGGRTVKPLKSVKALTESAIERKSGIPAKTAAAGTTNTNTSGTPNPNPEPPVNANVPLAFVDTNVNTTGQLDSGIDVGTSNPNAKKEPQVWGECSLEEGKFVDLDLGPQKSVQLMARGQNPVNTLGAPQGKRAVIIWARNREDIQDKWAWVKDVKEFTYADSGGTRYVLAGVIVKLKNTNGQDMLSIRYNAAKQTPVDYSPTAETQQMRPSDIGLVFVVPQGAQMGNLMFKTDVARSLPASVN